MREVSGGGHDSPILFALVFEVIHVATFAGVQGVSRLQIFRRSYVDQVAGILDHEVSFGETLHSLNNINRDKNKKKNKKLFSPYLYTPTLVLDSCYLNSVM